MNQPGKQQNCPSEDPPQVLLSVSGGVTDVIFKPKGIKVIIYDYDIDGVAETQKDPDGADCIISEWPAAEMVINNQNWSIIQDAKHDVTCRGMRKWQCPTCSEVIEVSYEEIIEVGTPHCRHCESEMTLM